MTTLLQLLPAPLQPAAHFFVQGGIFMIPLLLCSLISVAVIVMRGRALRRRLVLPQAIEREIEAIRPGDELAADRLGRFIHEDRSTLARIVRVGLNHLNWPKFEAMEAVQTRARHEIVRLESGLFVLEVIVGIAPLLGLLGAVSGLVAVFGAFGAEGATQDQRVIARGISEALSTTIVGLAVAIPSLIAFSYFSKKIETMAAEMESLIADLLSKCYYQQEQRAAVVHPDSDYAPARRAEPVGEGAA